MKIRHQDERLGERPVQDLSVKGLRRIWIIAME
jgi:hypothetical protein